MDGAIVPASASTKPKPKPKPQMETGGHEE